MVSGKNFCPEFISDFQGFEDQVDEVTADVVKRAGQLQLEVETEDVEELLASHAQELTIEELVCLEETRKAENQAQIQDSPAQGTMTAKQVSEAFKHLEAVIAVLEKMNPNFERSSETNNLISKSCVCYRETYNEKKRAAKPTFLDQFLKKPSSGPKSPRKESHSMILGKVFLHLLILSKIKWLI
ncbi:hypothetical protein Y1Q_0011319 [Alligator mississippiensis]|uniref:Uncharacterized protein n=1 Tax=Alligator mississippiensis TaxID=8496 RepID=A0A151N934_ALLMI|nr:hypothetical protein Y1Q_0011319 [Alligator mississippiensis]